jgi:hypothetical protein
VQHLYRQINYYKTTPSVPKYKVLESSNSRNNRERKWLLYPSFYTTNQLSTYSPTSFNFVLSFQDLIFWHKIWTLQDTIFWDGGSRFIYIYIYIVKIIFLKSDNNNHLGTERVNSSRKDPNTTHYCGSNVIKFPISSSPRRRPFQETISRSKKRSHEKAWDSYYRWRWIPRLAHRCLVDGQHKEAVIDAQRQRNQQPSVCGSF